MANILRRRRPEAPRAHRRRHDGLQEGARPRPTATSTRPSRSCASRAPRRPSARGAEREATAGLVAHAPGVLVELKCETDFVAKARRLRRRGPARSPTRRPSAKPADVEALRAVALDGSTVGAVVDALAVSIGEKIELGQYVAFEGDGRRLHAQACRRPAARRRRAWSSTTATPTPHAAAMQIAAMRPKYLTRDEVPAEIVEHERSIAEQNSREEGKPEQAIAKITEGRLNGFFKEVVLLEQPSVTENKKSVKAVLDESGTTVKRFARFEVGA